MSIKKISRVFILTVICLLLFASASYASVYDYNINYAVQSGDNEVTVQMQCEYCTGCNPNYENNPDGRYATVWIKNSAGVELAREKKVLNPSNWPLGVVHAENWVFSGVNLTAGETIIIEGDTYCSWCGHWYPPSITMTVRSSNTETVYTGDLQGAAGSTATVSASLVDNNDNPLAGKTVTFTFEGLQTQGVTDTNGVASSTIAIPDTMAPGTYDLTARFSGDQSYDPSSDTVDFQVGTLMNNASVFGVGFIDSPPGAFIAEPNQTGMASFMFDISYQSCGSVPVGTFYFNFGTMDFLSIGYNQLTVNGDMADFTGTGILNGNGNYEFLVTAVDGQFNNGAPPDLLRIKIWESNTGDVVYDSQAGDDGSAIPAATVNGGDITLLVN